MGRFLPRFATLYLCTAAYAFGAGHAEVTCTDEAGNNLCQGLGSFKVGLEDRAAYGSDGEQDFASGPMTAEIFPSQSFQVQQESSSGRIMPMWLWAGLGFNKSPETVTLFRGPTGFAVAFLQPQAYNEEGGQGVNIAKASSYRQAPTNFKQEMELNLAAQAKPGQPESSPQSQVQQKAAEWLAARAHSQPQSSAAASQVNPALYQQPQAGEQQQKGIAVGLHQNIIPHQSLGAVSGGAAPSAADARAMVHQAWLSTLQHHAAPVDNQHKQLRTGLWQVIGEQHKPVMTGSLAGHSLPLTGEPMHSAIAWQYHHSAVLPTSLNQGYGVASGKKNQLLHLGTSSQQGPASNVPSYYRAVLGHDASTVPISHASQHDQHVAVTTTLIGPNLVGAPGQVVTETQRAVTAQQTQKTVAQMEQQAMQHQQQASTNVGVGASLVERIARHQSGALNSNQQQTARKPEEPSAQTQQQPAGTNAAQNSTQAPGVAQDAAKLAASATQQQAAKQATSPGAGTPPHDLSATTSPPAQQQVTAQQQAVQGIGATKK